MADRDELRALAQRVMALAGPDRKTEEDVCRAIGWRFVREGHPIGCVWYNPEGRARPVPAFTANLDAAITLVPEDVTGIHLWRTAYGYECTLLTHDGPVSGSSQCESRPIALTAAALLALAEQVPA